MTSALDALMGRTQYDRFLYASIGVESNGMPLSVLSVLARLDFDPWSEASRLSGMSREAATLFLTALIADLPGGSTVPGDAKLNAMRLSALLPGTVHGLKPGK